MLGLDPTASVTPQSLGIWRVVGAPEWKAVFPPGDAPDPAIVKAIRSFQPNYVPLWLRKGYQKPTGSYEAFGYHVIGLHLNQPETADDVGEVVHLERPADWPRQFMSGAIIVLKVLWDDWLPGTWQKRCGVPRQYVPYDARLIDWMRARAKCLNEISVKEQRRRAIEAVDKQLAADDAAVAKVEQDTKLEVMEDRHSLLQGGMKGERSRMGGDPVMPGTVIGSEVKP